jgi:hypothetical protein
MNKARTNFAKNKLAQYIQQGIKQEYSTMNKVRISQ